MSSTTDPVRNMDMCPPSFWDDQRKLGFVDLRGEGKVQSHALLQHLLRDRPCGEGAVPPNLLDEYDKGDDEQKAFIACKYAGTGRGIDAYIVQLRMQIAYGAKLKNGLHERIRGRTGLESAAYAVWRLAQHHFGQDPDSDRKVKGYILWLMHGQENVDKIPQNTMEGLQVLAAKIAYPLMFERSETALFRPGALYGTGPSVREYTWRRVDLPLERIPTLHQWDGSVRLEDQLNSMLTKRNLAHDFPELTEPPGTGLILPMFSKPLLIPVMYKWNGEPASPITMRDMRSFRLCDRTPPHSSPAGITPLKIRDVHYDLCAVVNLSSGDVRLYGPRTMPITQRPPPDRKDAGHQGDTGKWKLGQKETSFLLWYHRIDMEDGETYMPPLEDAPEFISIEELENDRRLVGLEPQLKIERPTGQKTKASSSIMGSQLVVLGSVKDKKKDGRQPTTRKIAAMPPSTREALLELIGDEHVLEELRKVADPSGPYTSPVFLHGQPLAGNSSKYSVAMGLIDSAARIVSIQPTDQAASWALRCAQHWAPKKTIGHVPLWDKFDSQAITKARLSFVSARQVLRHGLEILGTATILIVDEVHHQPVDHELAIARVRDWVNSGDLPTARIVLMSSYMTSTSSSTPLFPDLSHVELEGSQRVTDMGHCTFGQGTSEDTTKDFFISFAEETLDHRIDPGDGPVLVFIPENGYITKFVDRLKSKAIATSLKGHAPATSKEKWQIRLLANLGEAFSPDDIGKTHLDGKSIVISPPFFDKCRREHGHARFRHVICPHWIIDDRYDKMLGQDVPCSALLSKSEMCFMAFHAGKAWLTCTRGTWDGASDRDSAEAERVAPTEYLIKAANVFPGLAPYRASPNAMPLRIFPAVHRTFWSLHQLRYSELLEILNMDKFGMVLTDAGKAAVGHMLDMGLCLRGSVFLQRAITLEANASDDTEASGLSLLHLAIPLAVSMGQEYPIMQYKWNASSDAERLKSLDSAVKKACVDLGVPSLCGHRKNGDDFLNAWLLVRYLACVKHSTGSTTWVLTISRYLPDVVAHIRRSLPATAAKADQGYGALAKTIAGDMDKPFGSSLKAHLIDMFHQCIYGAGLMNVACVTSKETSHGKSIGHGLNFNGGAPVLLSQGSVLDMDGLACPLYVTFDRIETVPRDADTGATHMISGLSPLSLTVMSDTHVYFSALDSWDPKKDTLRSNVQYPYGLLEK